MEIEPKPECLEDANSTLNRKALDVAQSINEEPHYPEGGYGWVIVVAGFIIYSVVPGILMSIGVMIKHYQVIMKDKTNTTTLTLVGSVSNSVFSFLAVAAGRFIDHFGHRISLIVGAIIFSGGLLLASFASESWHLFLTLGVLSGIGDSLITIAVISAPAQYFNNKLGIASGFIMAGYGAGGFCLSPAIEYMITEWSMETALRSLAGGSFTTIFLLSFCYQRAPKNKTTHGFGVIQQTRFQILFLGAFLSSIGYLVPFIIIPLYAESIKIDGRDGSFLLGLLNGSTSIGRIIMGQSADYFGRMNILLLCSVSASLSCLFWGFGTTYFHLVLFVVSYGITGGSFLSILSVAARQLFPNESIPGITGLIYFAVGLPYLAGPPVATEISRLLSSSQSIITSYLPAISFTAAFPLLALIPLLYLRINLSRSWKSKI
ncbi:hypothetical protein DSO57_1032306 [Entomophthora muscae]|uniref:Uncharacterized protein n=1 Tax=Entomophthora muscae TaxID=34485 RepID=A0ACC2RRG4_9FUNG|nr:hypothetical protein DSO57_1032306 [Entomophthora muscae]